MSADTERELAEARDTVRQYRELTAAQRMRIICAIDQARAEMKRDQRVAADLGDQNRVSTTAMLRLHGEIARLRDQLAATHVDTIRDGEGGTVRVTCSCGRWEHTETGGSGIFEAWQAHRADVEAELRADGPAEVKAGEAPQEVVTLDEAAGIFGPDWTGGLDPVDWVRQQRDGDAAADGLRCPNEQEPPCNWRGTTERALIDHWIDVHQYPTEHAYNSVCRALRKERGSAGDGAADEHLGPDDTPAYWADRVANMWLGAGNLQHVVESNGFHAFVWAMNHLVDTARLRAQAPTGDKADR